MPVIDPQRISDGFVSLERGVDSGRSPSLLSRNQLSFAVNATMRGGYAKTRPAFKNIPLIFNANTQSEADEIKDRFESGRFQGAAEYQRGRQSYIICSIDGYIHRINPKTGDVDDITPRNTDKTADPNSSLIETAYFQQAEEYMVVQDGRNRAIIFDGASSRRANLKENEVPTGTAMAYGGGRLWVARGREFVAGDIVGGPTSVIYFTENTYIAEGGAFSVPLDTGDITAMKFMNQPDISLGQGELLVHTANAVFAVNVPTNRDAWKNVEYPTVRIVAINYGSVSDRSCVLVNSDMFYRAPDGIRSYISSRREWQQYGQIPVSREMESILSNDSQFNLRDSVSAVLFDNRLITTTIPQVSPNGTYYRGLAVLDFDLVGGVGDKMPPAWDGLWTGLNVLQILNADIDFSPRCFVFHLQPDTCGIQLWELTRDGRKDNDTTDIACYIETPNYSFQNPFEAKQLEYGEMFVDEIEGSVAFDIKYKTNQYPVWVDWNAFNECVTYGSCAVGAGECMTFANHKPQYRTRIRLPQPADDCEPTNGVPMRVGYEMAVRIGWTGHARIKGFRMHAYPTIEEPYGGCGSSAACS